MNLSTSVYAEPINNTIFERKHHFMYILKEAETLKSEISEELMYGNVEASRLDEINSICTLAFAGLLQEGLAFRYERDTDSNKDALVITIDRIDYRCRTGALKNILKDKFPNIQNISPYSASGKDPGSSQPIEMPVTQDVLINAHENDTEYSAPASAVQDLITTTPVAKADVSSENAKKIVEPVFVAKTDVEMINKTEVESASTNTDTNVFPQPESKNISDNIDVALDSFIHDILSSEESAIAEVDNNANEKTESLSTCESPEENNVPFVAETADSDVEDCSSSVNASELCECAETTLTSEREAPKNNFEVIGATPINTMPLHFAENEFEKHKKAFVYQTVRASIRHEKSNHVENICFMIAPLEIKKDEISTKIIVYAYLNGKAYAQCSLENTNERNTISFSAGEYEFLVRGVFEDYNFSATIIPDGITAAQNDSLMILETINYAPKTKDIQCGHIKFNYKTSNNKDGLIEVFPTGFDNESFVVLRQYEEWIDILKTEEDKTLTQTADGLQEIVCMWEGDVLKAELVPAY